MERAEKMKKITTHIKYKNKKRANKAVCVLLVSGMLAGISVVNCEAAVITSNATDKVAVVFNENTAYSAGDYVTYNGELYICTGDTQGAWDAAEADFMQITKNQELGKSEDLSAVYDASKDPADEKSLMAFAANAWQKLKVFLGTDNRASDVGASDYKNASVSAKLNYLEEQNQKLSDNLTKLQGDVNNSFQFVSNGKQNLADAIADEEGAQLSPSNSFQQFCDAIHSLAQAKKDKGHEEGYKEGYDTGRSDGIQYADSNVNKESESYKQGLKDSGLTEYYSEIRLDYHGADKEETCFTSGGTESYKTWTFNKQFAGHTIYAVEAYRKSYSARVFQTTQMAVRVGSGSYNILKDSSADSATIQVRQDAVAWDGFAFNDLDGDSAYMILKIRVWYA